MVEMEDVVISRAGLDEPAEVLNARINLREAEGLTRRAVEIVELMHDGYEWVENSEFAKLVMGDTDARLEWPEGDYDSGGVDSESEVFPLGLLFASDGELEAWKTKLMEARERQATLERERAIARTEAHERAKYEQLKKKYG